MAVGDANAERIRLLAQSDSTESGNKPAKDAFEFFLLSTIKDGTSNQAGAATNQDGPTKLEDVFDELDSIQGEDGSDSNVLKGEEICDVFIRFADFLSGDVRPNTLLLKISTKLNYFGKVKEIFYAKFHSLDIWTNHDAGQDSGWYSSLRAKLEKKGTRTLFENDDEDADPSPRCRALVIRSSEEKLCQGQRIWLQKDGVDLESIVMKMLRSNETDKNKYERRAMLVTTYNAAARGGEIKFSTWRDVEWDYHFNCPQAWWTRMKTLVKQLLMFQCYRDGWICDFYHSFGCFFATGGLIRRQNDDASRRNMKRIFPSLNSKTNKAVARMMTDLIKRYCDENLKPLTSSRSLRVGAITELKVNPHVSETEAGYAGGFSSKDNSGIYLRPPPSMGVTTANALNNWPTPRRHDVSPPTLLILATKANLSSAELKMRLETLLATIFPSTLKDFTKDGEREGRLYVLAKTCFASMLMYHEEVNKELGRTNRISRAIVNAFKIAFETGDDRIAERIIVKWGKHIRDDYNYVNNRSICIANEGIDPEYMVQQRSQTAMIQNLFSTVMDFQTRLETRLNQFIRAQEHATNANANESAATPTPPPHQSTTHMTPPLPPPPPPAISQENNTTVTAVRQDMREENDATAMLTNPTDSHTTAPHTSTTTGAYPVSELLMDLLQAKSLLKNGTENLISEFWNATKPARIKSRETGVFEAFMKVFHLSIDDNDREYLCEQSVALSMNETTTHVRVAEMVQKVLTKMHSFDNKKHRNSNVNGLGSRAKAYFGSNAAADPSLQPSSNQRSVNSYFNGAH